MVTIVNIRLQLLVITLLYACIGNSFAAATETASATANNNRQAQVNHGFPSGLFISGGKFQSPELLAYDFVDGALLRVRWSELQPEPDRFDWSYLDGEIAKVKKAGKKYTLAIVGGPSTPSWLYESAQVAAYRYSIDNPYASKRRDSTHTIPVPWDKNFLAQWTAMIKTVGQRYQHDPDLYLVHITGSSGNGFELMLPYARGHKRANESMPDWNDYGYSRAALISAWQTIIDAFIVAFPHSNLDFEIHDVFNDYSIPAELIEYGISKAPARFGPFGAWLNNRGQRWVKPLRDIMSGTTNRPYCNYQLIGNETRQPQRLGTGGLKQTVELGLSDGCNYFEVWEIDIKNTNFHDWFRQLHERIGHR